MKISKHIFNQVAALSFAATLFSSNTFAQSSEPPFDVMEITHLVKDYAAWRPGFDNDSVNRQAYGLKNLVVGQGMENGNNVFIALLASNVQKSKDFTASPKLKEAMEKAGVISKPDVQFFRVIRFNPYSSSKQWVVVTHKVKDFDTWVKGYDKEGEATRENQGMIDVALARGIEDPNLVQIVFDITDLGKAKAAIFSEEKKTIMIEAGVIGKPKIEFFNTAN